MNKSPRHEAKSWFPPGAVDRRTLERALSAAIDRWGARWLTNASIDLVAVYQDLGQSTAWRCRSSDGVATAWREEMAEIFAGQMLSHRIAPGSLLPADRPLLSGLVCVAVDDLMMELASSLGPGGSSAITDGAGSEGETVLWWEVRQETRGLFHLGIAERQAAAWRRQSLAPSPAIALQSRRKGLAAHPLIVCAAVGRSEISLAELRGLAVGDTLVLDQIVDMPIALLVNDQPSRLRAHLTANDGKPHLTVCGSSES